MKTPNYRYFRQFHSKDIDNQRIAALFRAHPEWRGNWHALVRWLIDAETRRLERRQRARNSRAA